MTHHAQQRRISAWLRAMAAAVAALASLHAAPALAGDPPFGKKEIAISARGQPVRDFVTDLFAEAGLKAKVSTKVKGQVQGVFRGPPAEIWSTVARAYGLVAYWDGAMVRVYDDEEIITRSIAVAQAGSLVAQVGRLGMTDPVNTAKASDGMVLATGVPAFLDRLEDMANQQRMAVKTAPDTGPEPTVVQKTSATWPVASPLLKAPLARASVRSEVVRTATGRSPFEVRIFYLKYRDAADREVRSSDRSTVIPGVATLLIEQMGDGRQVSQVSSGATNEYAISGLRGLRDRGPSGFGNAGDGRGADDGRQDAPAYDPDGPRISADPTVNAVIVRDRPETMAVYEQLITNLDIEPLMIETQVTILELNVTKLKELGLDFGFGLEGLGVLFGGGLNLGPGGITGGFISGDGELFLARVRALEERGAIRIVTRPSISSPNNEVGSFEISSQQIVRLQGEREVDALSVNYGLVMRIRPAAIEDGGEMRIRMQVEIADTSLNGMVVDGIPTAAGPRISTQVIVPHGESVMLAGMTSTRTFDTKRKTPVLGDVPGLGQLFRKRRKGEDHVERLFLLTPRVSNLGSAQLSVREVEPLTLEQLRGTEPVRPRSKP